MVDIAALRGRPTLVLFVPLAFTPICSGELRAHCSGALAPARVVVVSCDAAATLAAWAAFEGVTLGDDVLVASDFWPHGAITTAWGAFDPVHGWPRRTSFLLDGAGVVRWSVTSPPGIARDVADAVGAVRALTVDAAG